MGQSGSNVWACSVGKTIVILLAILYNVIDYDSSKSK
jgi:hypothetical protein